MSAGSGIVKDTSTAMPVMTSPTYQMVFSGTTKPQCSFIQLMPAALVVSASAVVTLSWLARRHAR